MTTLSDHRPSRSPGLPLLGGRAVLILTLLLAASADFLLFERSLGLSLFLFAALLALSIAAANGERLGRRTAVPAGMLALAATLPLLENVSGVSVGLAALGLALLALLAGGLIKPGVARMAGQVAGFFAVLPFRLPADLAGWRRAAKGGARKGACLAAFGAWVVPATFAAIFIGLFGIANPVIEHWLSLLDPFLILDLIELRRLLFWFTVLVAAWAFLRPRLPEPVRLLPHLRFARTAADRTVGTDARPRRSSEILFGKAAILRALVLFNLLFAVQTVLDAVYLWGGVRLPDGLSYAAYAHRGAYPLIATALLAAGFVLVAMRPGGDAGSDPTVRRLVYLWVAQNVGLVLSSILRLDLYVGVYSLTYWRVAAFIWMGLVAAGLVLITARIALGKSNEWLVGANLVTLAATLYACAFVNFAAVIAEYNVAHSQEMGGGGRKLDVWYIRSLGPQAVPAIDRFLAGADRQGGAAALLRRSRRELARESAAQAADWRGWTFRGLRLARYLAANPAPPAAPAAAIRPSSSVP